MLVSVPYLPVSSFRMGVGLSEYRAAIGRFAWVAKFASFRLRRTCKKPKLTKLKKVGENSQMSNSTKLKGSSGSLDRWKGREKSPDVGQSLWQRSKSFNQTREGRSRVRKPQLSRNKSQSLIRRRKTKQNVIPDNFKNSCIACKTDLFDQRQERGRSRQTRQEAKKENCCSHPGKSDFIKGSQLRFFTCIAVYECLLLEQAVIAVVQMLLVRSGIETNPGPTNGDDSPCCNASQHFNRVRNTMTKAQNSFQSRVTPDTLSMKVIEIEETGNYLTFNLLLLNNGFTGN